MMQHKNIPLIQKPQSNLLNAPLPNAAHTLPLSSAELQDWKVLNHHRRCVFYLSGGSRGGRVRMAMDSQTAPDTSCDANSLTGKRSGGRCPGPDSRSVFSLKPYPKDSLMTSLLRFMRPLDRPSITHMLSLLQPAANGKPIHHRGSGCSKLRPHSWLQGHQVERWGSISYWLPPFGPEPIKQDRLSSSDRIPIK